MRIKSYFVVAIFVITESALLVSFTDPNKQFFDGKSVLKFLKHGFSM